MSWKLPKLKEKAKVKDYIITKELGHGQFGRVYEAINTKDNTAVAIKCVSKEIQTKMPKAYQLFQAEKNILSKIDNDNIVGFVDYFESTNICFLCLEFCNEGDLEDYLKQKPGKRVPEYEAIEYFKQILNGFRSIHQANILHRDLKLPNILKHNGQLKIADLGFAKQLQYENQLTNTILGTPYTMAPEILEEKSYSLPCDIYSVGVVFYQIVFGDYPFHGNTQVELIKNIKKQKIKFESPGVHISPYLKDLLSKMLKYNVSERINMEQIWDHPLFTEYIQQSTNEIGIFNLHGSNINPKQNKEFYRNLTFKNVEQNEENPFQYPAKVRSNKSSKKYSIKDPSSYAILDKYAKKKEIQESNKAIIQKYHEQINLQNHIVKSLFTFYTLPETRLNTYYPNFFMLKRLLHYKKKLVNCMENRENIFDSPYPQELFKSALYLNTLRDIKGRLEVLENFFLQSKYYMQSLMDQTPDPEIIAELNTNYTDKTEDFYKKVVPDYIYSLRNETKKNFGSNKIKEAILIQKHTLEIIDCVGIDTFFREEKDFDFISYALYRDGLEFDKRDELINKKLSILF